MEFWSILLDVVVILAGAMLFGGLFARFGQSPIVGYLLAGMILGGRGSLGLIKSESEIEAVAELGVSLLLFGLGLEFSLKTLFSLGTKILISGALQVIATLGLTALIATAFGCSMPLALVIGSMLCLSSTACVMRTLADKGDLDSSHGRNSLAILLVQDVAVVVLAMLVVVVCESGIGFGAIKNLGRILLLAAGLVLILYIFINQIVVRLLGVFSVQKNRDLGVLLAVTLGLGSTWAAHTVNISPALGAFIAGMFLGSSPFAVQVRADVASLQVILLTLFFGSAGMLADPIWIINNWALVFSLAALIIVLKTLIVALILFFLGQPASTAVVTGICIGQVGEFAFVLADIATKANVLPEELGLLLISSTIITMFLTPFLLKIAPRIGTAVAKNKFLAQLRHQPIIHNGAHKHETKILIIGYGPAGQMTASALTDYGQTVLVLDLNKNASGKNDGKPFRLEIGDATREDVLLHSNVSEASIVVITLPDRKHSLQVLHLVKKLAPDAWIIVRARYHRDTESYYEAGASMVVDEEAHVGLALAEYTKSFS